MCETCLVTMGALSCPNCVKTWTRTFIVDKLTVKTANVLLNTKQAEILFDQMVATIPTSQVAIQNAMEEDVYNKERQRLTELRNKALIDYRSANRDLRMHYFRPKQNIQRKVDYACPIGTCMGMISDGECILCKQKLCEHCHEIITEGHECNKDSVASVREIRQNSRPCPKCSSPIIKSSGCDQMYCTKPMCETFFSWTTGRVTQGVAHNPEYTRFLAAGGRPMRDARDEVCGGMPGTYNIKCAFGRSQFDIATYVQYFNHIIVMLLPQIGNKRTITNRDVLINYALHRINAEKARKILIKRKKESEFNTELFNVFSLLRDVGTEGWVGFVQTRDTAYLKQINQIITYVIGETTKIQKVYGSKAVMYLSYLKKMINMDLSKHILQKTLVQVQP